MWKVLMLLLLCALQTGCYYMQAASGQLEVLRKRKPVVELIENPDTSPELADRLRLVVAARDFSVDVLGLPDNNSYRSYTQLERDYVVWNVFAAPEFSLQAKQWCFPIAGCVNYLGYFSQRDALKASARLAEDGFDVAVGGVAAYSTLGKFDDPILSTMMRWDDIDLVAVLFHELAHQVVYVKDDSAFNESFATAVEEIGVQRWLDTRNETGKMAAYLAGRELRQSLLQLVSAAKSDLDEIFAADIDVSQKRARKKARLQMLADDVAAEMRRRGSAGTGWLSGELNNARLISMTLYEGRLPSFRALYRKCEEDLTCFYAAAREMAAMSPEQREAALPAAE
jgi:predicted aminopeptidase